MRPSSDRDKNKNNVFFISTKNRKIDREKNKEKKTRVRVLFVSIYFFTKHIIFVGKKIASQAIVVFILVASQVVQIH